MDSTVDAFSSLGNPSRPLPRSKTEVSRRRLKSTTRALLANGFGHRLNGVQCPGQRETFCAGCNLHVPQLETSSFI